MKRPLITIACIRALSLPVSGSQETRATGASTALSRVRRRAGYTACAGSGAFAYFGKDHNLAGGANGYQTGLNNSSLCSNRQGDLP